MANSEGSVFGCVETIPAVKIYPYKKGKLAHPPYKIHSKLGCHVHVTYRKFIN
jgi:hypothetical protein